MSKLEQQRCNCTSSTTCNHITKNKHAYHIYFEGDKRGSFMITSDEKVTPKNYADFTRECIDVAKENGVKQAVIANFIYLGERNDG